MIPRKPHHKGLERSGKPMKRVRLRPFGKSNRAKDRRDWQAKMIAKWGYGEYCEWLGGCSDTFGIANAHRLVKTKITTEDEWVNGRCFLCQRHHRFVDYGGKDENGVYHAGGHERQYRLITAIISSR